MPRSRRHHDDSVSFREDDETLADLFGGSRGRTETRRARHVRALLALVVSLAVVALLAWGVARFMIRPEPISILPEQCVISNGQRTVELEHDQTHYAALITGVAVREGFGERGAAIALATAMQESSLRNLTYGDADSLGLFQQRPSQGWGTKEQVQDPFYATETFLAHLRKVPNWRTGDINDVAQSIQRSGVPDGYAKRVPDALVLAEVFAGTGGEVSCLDRSQLPPSSASFVAELNQTWGVSAAATGATVRVTGATPAIARAWAAFAVANMRPYGITKVQVGPREWAASEKTMAPWNTTDPALGEREVLVTFRA